MGHIGAHSHGSCRRQGQPVGSPEIGRQICPGQTGSTLPRAPESQITGEGDGAGPEAHGHWGEIPVMADTDGGAGDGAAGVSGGIEGA